MAILLIETIHTNSFLLYATTAYNSSAFERGQDECIKRIRSTLYTKFEIWYIAATKISLVHVIY